MKPTAPHSLGQTVAGKFRLLEIIGEGGMGVVYLAEHSLIEKRIALKVLRAEYSAKPDLVARFQQEAISASRIKHPNVLDVFDFGQLEDGCFFLAMEHLQGHDLATELTQTGVVNPHRAVRIALQTCRALAAAHARGVVHRDLKPENVFLHRTAEGDEIVKIVDFGIAQLRKDDDEHEPAEVRRRRLTKTGMIFGTPEYMSPEQAAGRRADLRVDIYALGVILFEMFTGSVPFTGETFMAVLSAHLTEPLPDLHDFAPELEISPGLEAAVLRALEKDPADRWVSMNEFAQILQATPEGRDAAPFGGLVPIPEITPDNFRTARENALPTPRQFETGSVTRPNPTPVPSRQARTLIGGSSADLTTASTEPPARSHDGLHRRVVFGALSAALVLGGGLLWWRLTPHHPSSHGLASASSAAPLTKAVVSAAPTTDTTEPKASAAAPSLVTLHIVSEPPGATVLRSGFQVCDAAPCALEVARDLPLELTARLRDATASAKVLPQSDQTVTLTLKSSPAPVSRKKKSDPKLCEVVVDGLKILRPCP